MNTHLSYPVHNMTLSATFAMAANARQLKSPAQDPTRLCWREPGIAGPAFCKKAASESIH